MNNMSDGDFDDIVEELGGFGKYQKRLLYLLLSKAFNLLIVLSFCTYTYIRFHKNRNDFVATFGVKTGHSTWRNVAALYWIWILS